MVFNFPAQAQVKWIRGYEESDFLVVVSLWVDGWRWQILASHICVWFISGVRSSHLVAAPTLADKRQTTISPLVSDRAHQQITRAGGWELEDWVELRTFYLNLNMTAMPFQYIWHQGSLQTFNRVLCFYLGLLSKDWQQQRSAVVSAVVTVCMIATLSRPGADPGPGPQLD